MNLTWLLKEIWVQHLSWSKPLGGGEPVSSSPGRFDTKNNNKKLMTEHRISKRRLVMWFGKKKARQNYLGRESVKVSSCPHTPGALNSTNTLPRDGSGGFRLACGGWLSVIGSGFWRCCRSKLYRRVPCGHQPTSFSRLLPIYFDHCFHNPNGKMMRHTHTHTHTHALARLVGNNERNTCISQITQNIHFRCQVNEFIRRGKGTEG